MSQNKVIFGYPRSGTKLLASLFQHQGYFNFGEFFALTTDIQEDVIPYAVRKSVQAQEEFRKERKTRGSSIDNIVVADSIRNRLDIFNKYKDTTPSVATVWMDNFLRVPELLESLNDRFFLCTRRSNEFEQLLSRAIVYKHSNYNDEIPSAPFSLDVNLFVFSYYQLNQTVQFQNYLIKQDRGCIIDFDELISGTSNLGFDYSVTSKDQHADVTGLILNLEEIKKTYQYMKTNYPH